MIAKCVMRLILNLDEIKVGESRYMKGKIKVAKITQTIVQYSQTFEECFWEMLCCY